jgi:hypothetical protein
MAVLSCAELHSLGDDMLELRQFSIGIFCVCCLFAPARSSRLSADEPTTPHAMAARIDERLAAHWQSAAIEPSPPASDAEFLRRVYLDLTGKIPTVSEARKFLDDDAPDRRARIVAELVARPAHATHLANTWTQFLLPQDAAVAQFGGGYQFHAWLSNKFVDNVPYDAIVRELLLAEGQFNQSGATLFYYALELKPEEIAASTSRAFLGVQIQCAQCHDHPHDHWTQRDFWAYAAFFARLQQPANAQQVFGTVVREIETGEVKLPETDEVVPPRYLGGDEATAVEGTTRRQQLAAWLASTDNPYFARASVNRVWSQMFGRGIVDPADDLGQHNAPSHPELLDELAAYFVRTKFDLRGLFQTLALTQAYQRSSAGSAESSPLPSSFARMAIKTLSAEQLYDCLAQATAKREMVGNQFVGNRQFFDQNRQAFINKFRAPTAGLTEYQSGIPQALTLMNGTDVRSATDLETSDILISLTAPFFSDQQRIDVLFLATLSRRPTADEQRQFGDYVAAQTDPADKRKALGDILWALVNSAEFSLNH